MRFELLDSFSLPGDPKKPNEDSSAHTDAMALVIDGATGLSAPLMPGASDAHWIATFAARRMKAHSQEGGGPEDWLLAAAQNAENSFNALRSREPKERYELPLASLMLSAIVENEIQFAWFGDCAALLRTGEGVTMIGDTLQSRAAETIRARSLSETPAALGVREEYLPRLRDSRNRVNTQGGAWLFAPDAACAGHARHAAHPAQGVSRLLLATDGFLALAADYGRYSPEALLAAAEKKGLKALTAELRSIEASDPDGRQYPRFKRSDDATALLLQVSA
jgi:Protein phosphatase 2C